LSLILTTATYSSNIGGSSPITLNKVFYSHLWSNLTGTKSI
jgi:hypothetical protein